MICMITVSASGDFISVCNGNDAPSIAGLDLALRNGFGSKVVVLILGGGGGNS